MLIPVNPNNISNLRSGRRGALAYPVLKLFLESNSVASQVDRKEFPGKTAFSLYTSFGAYIKTHKLPVKCVQRDGEIYLLRTDKEGSPVYDADAASRAEQPNLPPEELAG